LFSGILRAVTGKEREQMGNIVRVKPSEGMGLEKMGIIPIWLLRSTTEGHGHFGSEEAKRNGRPHGGGHSGW